MASSNDGQAAVATATTTPAAGGLSGTSNIPGASTQTPVTTENVSEAVAPPAVGEPKTFLAGSQKPSDEQLAAVLKLDLLDETKTKISLGSLVQGDAATPRTVVVFIRHFFCGLCQDYIRALMQQLPPSKLAALSPSTKLIVIGHGDPALIPKYSKETGCEFAIYADPTRKVYEKLGFVSNLQQGKTRPGYLKRSIFSNVVDSLRQNISAGSKMFGGGKISQNGGEMVFTNGQLGYFYRMKNTTDHTEAADLEKVLSL